MLSDICNFKILFVCVHTYMYIFSFIRQMEVCYVESSDVGMIMCNLGVAFDWLVTETFF